MKRIKRILSLIGVILLVSIYLLTLVGALTHSKYSDALFQASVYSTIVVPVMLYGYMLVYRIIKKDTLTKQSKK
jgi:quinol-cytochrome oxidoreductase complex cytochrome b subunit